MSLCETATTVDHANAVMTGFLISARIVDLGMLDTLCNQSLALVWLFLWMIVPLEDEDGFDLDLTVTLGASMG